MPPYRALRMVMGCFSIVICILAALAAQAFAANPGKTQANDPAELRFTSSKPHKDPFNERTVGVAFKDPDGIQTTVPAFWDGGLVRKIRYASSHTGQHWYQTVCSDTADNGLNGQHGLLGVIRYRGKNPLYRHGPVRTAEDHRHFAYADGKPFFWPGDTWWMGLASRL